jgi:hypothetical protein
MSRVLAAMLAIKAAADSTNAIFFSAGYALTTQSGLSSREGCRPVKKPQVV